MSEDLLDLEIVNKDLGTLRNAVYEIVTPPPEQSIPDINQTQNMGVALTNSMKKEGVNIVQIQQTVNVHVINTSIKALKIIDNIQNKISGASKQDIIIEKLHMEIEGLKEQLQISNDSIKQLDVPRIVNDAIADMASAAYEEKLNLDELTAVVRKEYLIHLCEKNMTTKEIAKFLGVSTSGVSVMKREFGLTKRKPLNE